jgi:hypothetical protein
MKKYIGNFDFEHQLRTGANNLKVRQELEYLLWFAIDTEFELVTQKKYELDYMESLQDIIGRKAYYTHKQEGAENWWGDLSYPKVKEFNSKFFCANFCQENDIFHGSQIINNIDPILDLPGYLVKSEHSMSGSSIFKTPCLASLSHKNFPLLVEPLHARSFDFSYLNGPHIFYENSVDHNFQYKGTLIDLRNCHRPSFLDGEQEITYRDIIAKVQMVWGKDTIWSMDSYGYYEDGELKIRFISEINFRKTMGYLCYAIAHNLKVDQPFCYLTIQRANSRKVILRENEILLSPADTYFQVIFGSTAHKPDFLTPL